MTLPLDTERRRTGDTPRRSRTRPSRRAHNLPEAYLARRQAGERAARERQVRSAAEELTRERARVRYDRSIYVPEDQICLFVFDAPSGREAALAAQRAGPDPIRVVEAV